MTPRLVAPEVESYLDAVPDGMRGPLEKLRATIRSALPEATEVISYQVPMFKQDGHGVVAYAAFKKHCSLFVMSTAVAESFAADMADFESAKGTVHFTPDHPLPARVVKKIVAARLKENAETAAQRKKRQGDAKASRKAAARG